MRTTDVFAASLRWFLWFVPRNNFEIAISHFCSIAAFWPIFRALFAEQIGTKSLIK
jgi:hypothetical protein